MLEWLEFRRTADEAPARRGDGGNVKRITAGVTLILILGLSGPAGAYEAMEVGDGGTLTGIVRFGGNPPRSASIPVKKDTEVCGDSKPSEALVLGPDRGVKHAVLWIEGISKGKKIETKEIVLDNTNCLFVPHVVALAIGSTAKVKNSDRILHNTHGFLGGATLFNLALPFENQVIEITRRLKKPGVVNIQCDAHPHMLAWMIVHDNPYIAVTDERGRFRIADIPAGKYRVVLWHEPWKVIGSDGDGRPIHDKPVVIAGEATIPVRGEAKIEFELK